MTNLPPTQAGVTVWVPSAAGRPWQADLLPGRSLRFGRGAPEAPMHLVLTESGVSRLAGEVRAVDDHWRLSNFSSTATYVVENAEGAGEFVKVPPRRLEFPVPFEFCRVLLVPGRSLVGFHVTASQHLYAADDQFLAGGAEPTTTAFHLDRTARYFLVLVALCEPRLRDPSSTAMPSAGEIVQRLRPLPPCRELTVDAVHAQIKYLASTKLRVREDAGSASRDRQRESLVAVALRFDLVGEPDLLLLPRT